MRRVRGVKELQHSWSFGGGSRALRRLAHSDTEHFSPSGAGFDPPPPVVFAQGAMTSE